MYLHATCSAAVLQIFLPLLLALVCPGRGAAQADGGTLRSDSSLQELRRADGSREIGWVVAERGDTVTFETVSGERLEVRRRFVRIRPARGRVVDGEFWPEDRHTTRLFFAPTGRTLPEGSGYAGLFVVLPFVGYGVTDDVTLAGGIPLVGALNETPVWFAPKVRVYDTPGAQVSTGVFAIHLPADDPSYCGTDCGGASWNGVAYALGTFGDRDNALHAGAGVTFGGDGSKLPVMVGGERRVSRRNKLITENWLIPGEGGAASFGVRRLGERWTTDYGLMFFFGSDAGEIPYVPILSFSYAF